MGNEEKGTGRNKEGYEFRNRRRDAGNFPKKGGGTETLDRRSTPHLTAKGKRESAREGAVKKPGA